MSSNHPSRGVALIGLSALFLVEGSIAAYWFLHVRDAGPGPGWIRVGSVEQLRADRITFVDSVPAYLVATADGMIGLYARSPQLGERVTYCPSSGWFEDSMHGSMFDAVGDYVVGPAPRGLDRLEVRTIGDDVWLNPMDHLLGSPRGTHSAHASPQAGPFCLDARA